MSESEFSRPVRARHLPTGPIVLEADAAERAALAHRVGVVAVDRLSAEVNLIPEGDAIAATGMLAADLLQTCAISGEAFAVHLDEPLALRFVPPIPRAVEVDLELPADEADEIEFSGETFDLGEAIAQSLALAIDPYAEGPGADAARATSGIVSEDAVRGPLADLLAGLKRD